MPDIRVHAPQRALIADLPPMPNWAIVVHKDVPEATREAMRAAIGTPDPEEFLSGLPDYELLPDNFNLATILWLLNLAEGWDLVDFARWRYGLLSNADHWFAGNKPRTPQEVDADRMLLALAGYPGKERVPERLRRAAALLGGQENRRLSEGG